MEIDRERPEPADAEGSPGLPAAVFRRHHRPAMIWLGMVVMVTLAFVLGSLTR